MDSWRLIDDTNHPGSVNMALDYALLSSVSGEQSTPVLRFYGWESPTITIGYFQSVDLETDREECRSRNIKVIRRITGGGAVFHADEITYSVVIPLNGSFIPDNINASYSVLLSPIVDALRAHSVNAVHVPINDILVDGRKISGSAQVRRNGVLLQHGTIILDMDIPTAFKCLTVPESKNASHGILKAENRVTTLMNIAGESALTERFRRSLKDGIAAGFAEKFNITFAADMFSNAERAVADEISREVFSNREWNESRKTGIDMRHIVR